MRRADSMPCCATTGTGRNDVDRSSRRSKRGPSIPPPCLQLIHRLLEPLQIHGRHVLVKIKPGLRRESGRGERAREELQRQAGGWDGRREGCAAQSSLVRGAEGVSQALGGGVGSEGKPVADLELGKKGLMVSCGGDAEIAVLSRASPRARPGAAGTRPSSSPPRPRRRPRCL